MPFKALCVMRLSEHMRLLTGVSNVWNGMWTGMMEWNNGIYHVNVS